MHTGFDREVPPGGYAWWYVDALSDDGRHGLTLIAFVGSVFSPYYAWRRQRRSPALTDPVDHCALNVALYGAGGKRWAMTERGRDRVQRQASSLAIGPSTVKWEDDALIVRIDEVSVPVPGRIRGIVRVHPTAVTTHTFALDAAGRHHWSPIAPCARVEVELERPGLAWTGSGYLDSNTGDEPLEAAFSRWDWSRTSLEGGDTAVLYDVERRDGSTLGLALRFDPMGGVRTFALPPAVRLPSTLWRVARGTRADDGRSAAVMQTLEDAPFYSRSVLSAQLLGEPVTAVHESLSLERFSAAWVRTLLPFRMPRVAR